MPDNILIRVGAETASAVRELGRVDQPLRDVQTRSEKMSGAIKRATLPSIAVLGALGVAAKSAADDASNLNEAGNAVSVVFGKATPKLSAFAKTAAQEAGLSMRQFYEDVTPVGAALQNAGFSADQAATASINLAKRAADMASVFNVDVNEALGAIQSGLRGEADPLERFGVGLSAAAVQAKAMQLGLADSTAALTNHDLAQARLALIMDQTNKLAGDFTRTSGSLANAQRINAAETENQRAKLGQGLLPVMQAYQRMLGSVIGFLGEHTTATKVAIGVVAGLAGGVLVLNAGMKLYQAGTIAVRAAVAAWTAAQWLLNAALTANPVGIVVAAIAALAAGIYVAYTRSETFRNAVHRAWDLLKLSPLGVVISQFDTLAGAVSSVVSWISQIHWPEPPSWLKKVGGFLGFGGAAPSGGIARSFGAPIRASSSARSSSPRSTGSSSGGIRGAGTTIVVNVSGALDPEGTARAIERVLAGHRRRMGVAAA